MKTSLFEPGLLSITNLKKAHFLVKILVGFSLFATPSCSKKKSTTEATSTSQAQHASGQGDGVVPPDYPKLFCDTIRSKEFRVDLSQEISLLCRDGVPTANLLKLREMALSAEKGVINYVSFLDKNGPEPNTSEVLMGWSFHVPIRPFEVKSRDLFEYLTPGFRDHEAILTTTAAKKPLTTLDKGGLHLWSAKMEHKLTIDTKAGQIFQKDRVTEYNLYQLLSGNEEMGVAEEHLDGENQDYLRSIQLTFSFNDGTGYNNDTGGAIIITLVHMIVRNEGFPDITSSVTTKVSKAMGQLMYEGLKE